MNILNALHRDSGPFRKRHLAKISGLLIYLLTIFILAACNSGSPTPMIVLPNQTASPLEPDTSSADTTPTPSPAASSTSTGKPTPTPQTDSSTSLSLTPIEGGTAILGLVGRPDSLNPITENNLALRELTPLLFDTLLRIDPQTAQLQPGLAHSWEYSADGQQVVFHLPPNLKWSNGNPLTATDITTSLAATEHPALLAFSDISARDEVTLVFTFLNIDCAAVTTLAQLPLLPAAEITATVPTGSGPFIVNEWPANKRTLNLTQNPNYHGPNPYLDSLIIRFLQEDEITIALSEGQFDLIGPLQSISPFTPHVSRFTDIVYPAPQVIYLAINFDPHNDAALAPETRQALVLALDREAMLKEALAGDGQLLAASLLPTHWAANHTLSPPGYDPVTARALLTQVGLRDSDGDGWLDQNGERVELSIRLNGKNLLHQNLGWLASSYYRDLGLFARSESVPFDSVVDDLFTHDFTLAIFSWPLLVDPDQRLFWHSTENTKGAGLNFTSYNNPQVDELLEKGAAISGCQPETRAEIYAEEQKILAQERPVDFLLTPNQHILVSPHLYGLQPGSFVGFTWNAAEWYVEQE